MKPEIHLDVPGGVKNVLLHCCCAPCSSAIVECLLDNGVRPTLFFCNPNIYPREEYERRKAECIRHAGRLGLDFVDADYDHDGWVVEISVAPYGSLCRRARFQPLYDNAGLIAVERFESNQ